MKEGRNETFEKKGMDKREKSEVTKDRQKQHSINLRCVRKKAGPQTQHTAKIGF